MAIYKWDKETKALVKISDRSYPRPSSAGSSLSDQVLAGYRRIEERGQRHYGTPAGIKKIWSQ